MKNNQHFSERKNTTEK